MTQIAIVVGSLRKQSYNRRLAQALVKLAPAGVAFSWPDIGSLPLYDQDEDDDQPQSVKALKAAIRAADAVIFVTPEYNRSIPGVLKNAIDHASRPYGKSAWRGKPAGIVGVSPGILGTAPAQQHLRNVLSVLDMPTMSQPEAYIRWDDGLLVQVEEQEEVLREDSAEFLRNWLAHFLAFVARNKAGASVK
jgi:chromate reductase